MKGVIFKDLLTAKSVLLLLGVMMCISVLFPVLLAASSGEEMLSEGMMGIFCAVLLEIFYILNMVIVISFGGYDEQCGWDSFGNTLPLSRAKVVLARYGTGLLMMTVSLALLLAVQLIYRIGAGQPIVWYFPALFVMFCLATESFINPIIYQFGPHKAGYFIAGMSMAIGLGGSAVGNWMRQHAFALDTLFYSAVNSRMIPIITLLGVVACAILYGLSLLLSISIYRKKEF